MAVIRSRPDGSKYPITPKKGGGAVVAAAILAGGLAAGGGLGGAGSAGTTGSALDAAAGQALRAKTSSARAEARQGRAKRAWSRLGWRRLERWGEQAANCAMHSYGEVQQFFLRTPCRSLKRRLLVLRDGHGNTIVVAIAWVRMANRDHAQRLKDLADTDGTGNVTPRRAAALGVAGVEFTGLHYHSERRGATTVIAEAEPVTGQPDGAVLDAATEIAVAFPPPRRR